MAGTRPDVAAMHEEMSDLRGSVNLAAASMERLGRDLLVVETRRRRNVVGQIGRDVVLAVALLLIAYVAASGHHTSSQVDKATSPAAQAQQAQVVKGIQGDLADIKGRLSVIEGQLGAVSQPRSTPPTTAPAARSSTTTTTRPTTTTTAPPAQPQPPPTTTTTRPCLLPGVTLPGGTCP